jgi:two-component system sensor histidine kinase AlgZ
MIHKDSSIRQNPLTTGPAGLPGFLRVLRVLLVVNVLVALAAVFSEANAMRWLAASISIASLIVGWLHLSQQARSPALAEARLMALTARIRPHFLFNSLNGILGIIRSDPRRAEKALEELAELFRALMQDPRELVPLSAEIALCRQYIELERLRLGERVRVNWDIEQCPPDALMPPLMLQPLLENAVYHGIEPASEPGVIDIKLLHSGGNIVIVMSNPHEPSLQRSSGNQMALANIRERLVLFYDLAAHLDAEVRNGAYTVRIVLPYRKRMT